MFPQIFGKYVLEREIARGGMAHVYLATLRGAGGFEKRLVVKQIRPELASDEAFVHRFVAEAKTTVELSHPNIVPVYELGVEQGVYYIAMEFCEGVTLAELLAASGPLSPEEGAVVGVEVCRALDYAHRRANIVHRDVTPRNVLVTDEGGVRLIDFGIAAPAHAGANARCDVFGSPGHMPPEQLAGLTLTPATDVFAVGALLIEAWTGRPPFRRGTLEECRAALDTKPPELHESDPRLAPISELIARAVSPEVTARPESAESLARALRHFLRGTDWGEVERRLGRRVARARRVSHGQLGQTSGSGEARATGDPQRTPVARPDVEPVTTLTFAARRELGAWTRKLPDSEAQAPSERVLPVAAARRTQRMDPATPKVVEIEPVPARPRGVRSVVVASGAVIALLALFWARPGSRGARVERGARALVQSASAAGGAESARVRSAPTVTQVALSPTAPAEVSKPVSPASANQPVSPPTAASVSKRAQASARCSLTLSAEPPARVKVAGHSGQTPLALHDLEPGTYEVIFEEPTLHERLSGTVELAAGASKRLHADFTGAAPKLY